MITCMLLRLLTHDLLGFLQFLNAALLFHFVLANVLAQNSNVLALELQEVETVHSSESELKQVIIQTLFGNADESGRIFK